MERGDRMFGGGFVMLPWSLLPIARCWRLPPEK